MSPQLIQKLPAITLLEGMFPELSTNQLKVCVFYAMGVPYDAIAQNCRLSPETVRTYLKRSLKNLNLEGYDALRSAVLMRTFVFMISNTAKEGANKQVISSQADSLIKISRIWADFFPANTSNQPI